MIFLFPFVGGGGMDSFPGGYDIRFNTLQHYFAIWPDTG